MKLALLVGEAMKPIPKNIKIVEDWGDVSIVHNEPDMYYYGDHMYLEGNKSDFVAWLKPFDGIWLQKGSCPMLQEFEVGHIKD